MDWWEEMSERPKGMGSWEKSNYLRASGCDDNKWQTGRAAAYFTIFITAVRPHWYSFAFFSIWMHTLTLSGTCDYCRECRTAAWDCLHLNMCVLVSMFLQKEAAALQSPWSCSPVKADASELPKSFPSFALNQQRWQWGCVWGGCCRVPYKCKKTSELFLIWQQDKNCKLSCTNWHSRLQVSLQSTLCAGLKLTWERGISMERC